jgi:ribulose-5-phosphate 4-epimerase/fuculose-1-phosphate aldolase
MTFRPTPEELLPPLSPRLALTLLARTLWREGYDDHLAGHISYRQEDGSLLTNPWYLLWDEFTPDQVARIDLDGAVLEGEWPPAPGIQLHLALHQARDVAVAVHHHPRWATIWADMRRIPECLDQSSALGGGTVVLVDEYGGGVDDAFNARRAVAMMGDADIALLAGHGVLVLGDSIRQAHQRSVAFEQRCAHAWLSDAAHGGVPIPSAVQDQLGRAAFPGFWEAMARRELRLDPFLVEAAVTDGQGLDKQALGSVTSVDAR